MNSGKVDHLTFDGNSMSHSMNMIPRWNAFTAMDQKGPNPFTNNIIFTIM